MNIADFIDVIITIDYHMSFVQQTDPLGIARENIQMKNTFTLTIQSLEYFVISLNYH